MYTLLINRVGRFFLQSNLERCDQLTYCVNFHPSPHAHEAACSWLRLVRATMMASSNSVERMFDSDAIKLKPLWLPCVYLYLGEFSVFFVFITPVILHSFYEDKVDIPISGEIFNVY